MASEHQYRKAKSKRYSAAWHRSVKDPRAESIPVGDALYVGRAPIYEVQVNHFLRMKTAYKIAPGIPWAKVSN